MTKKQLFIAFCVAGTSLAFQFSAQAKHFAFNSTDDAVDANPADGTDLPAQTLNVLHAFDGTDGQNPLVGLVQATDGNLYGTAVLAGPSGGGTVFKITPSDTLTVLYGFCSQTNCADGQYPGGLTQGSDGNFYGTTSAGGASGNGTVFKITSSGTLATLHSFDGTDGASPIGVLVEGTDGNFYGTTHNGGANGYGAVFKVTATGTLTTLHSFDGTDGAYPYGGVIQATDGNFYGTTTNGGAIGDGAIFKITSGGTLTTLHSFDGADGDYPSGALVQATDGSFYGTTIYSGAYGGGTVFNITPTGTFATLYNFCAQSNCADGDRPAAALIQATDGNLYGTTQTGGDSIGDGTLFKITPGGGLTTLVAFCCHQGNHPNDALVQDTNGKFYGTTNSGGVNNDGTVFSLWVGLSPFVSTRPTLAKVGAEIQILGTGLTSATSVTFNGTPATFTVVSDSLITTTVPTGATNGRVQVVTLTKTLDSDVPFRVR